MKISFFMATVFCLITLFHYLSATPTSSTINYTLLIFPDFCIPKIFYFDPECIKLTLSKFLSVGMLLGSLGFKVPQILKFIKAKSTKGFSINSLILDTLSSSINVIFFFSQGIPFKSYGENVSIIIQNMISRKFIGS